MHVILSLLFSVLLAAPAYAVDLEFEQIEQSAFDGSQFSVSEVEDDTEEELALKDFERETKDQPKQQDANKAIDDIVASYNGMKSKEQYLPRAKLQGLNKITARTNTINATVGQGTFYSNLEIVVKLCWTPPKGSINRDSKALIEIWEHRPHQDVARIYYAWMVAGRPSLSPLEHPVYDITLKECVS